MLVGIGMLAHSASPAAEVNLYSSRQPFLVEPLLEAFRDATGIEVNMAYIKKGMLERLRAEGVNSPADAILTTDIGVLENHAQAGLLDPVDSRVLTNNIPAQYRHPDGLWFGLTMRARVIFAHRERVVPGEVTTYEDLAAPHMKGRICTRSGKHAYNISLLASVVAAEGEAAAEAWARGLKDNLARRPQGNDRAQVKAVKEGECDVALGNTYYLGKMATNEKNPEQKEWAAAVRIVFPNQDGRGTHVNISGAAVVKGADHRDDAIRLIEYLAGDDAQAIYARRNFEYPVKAGVPLLEMVESWGAFKSDAAFLTKIAEHRTVASKIMDRVAFDH
ncbi:MAG: extracellular solute-binding protein [Alphaproteobacteria bacterium]|nr:extracellular solute-binding protein [Alphaproteobacteria bacterium]MDP6515454.1 extracellular solute-binding protein [Alphaproteobacteria bacterium]